MATTTPETDDVNQPTPFCSKCGIISESLQRCAKCSDVFYCSKDHQVAHWATHKKICGDRRTRLGGVDYFKHAAYINSEARELAQSVGLSLSSDVKESVK